MMGYTKHYTAGLCVIHSPDIPFKNCKKSGFNQLRKFVLILHPNADFMFCEHREKVEKLMGKRYNSLVKMFQK